MRVSAIVLATILIVGGAGVRAATTNISQSGQKFSEKSIDLKPGDFLNFQNQDDVSHNITVLNDRRRRDRSRSAETGRDREICLRQGWTFQNPLQYSPEHEDDRNG